MLTCEEAQEFLDKYHNADNVHKNPVKYYLPDEVVVHNKLDDIWVIINGNVLDLTNFFQSRTEFLSPVKESRLIFKFIFFFTKYAALAFVSNWKNYWRTQAKISVNTLTMRVGPGHG